MVNENPEEIEQEEGTLPESPPEQPQVTMEELQQQLADVRETSRKYEENWKNEQRVSSSKEQKLKQLQEQQSNNETQQDILKALIATVAGQQSKAPDEFEDEIKSRQPDLLKQYEQIAEANKKQRQQAQFASQINEIQARTEASGLKVGDEEYDLIKTLAEAGQFAKAEKRLEKVEQAKQTKPPEVNEPKESEDDRVERLANEKLRKLADEKGWLIQEDGGPSAVSSGAKKAMADYAQGTISLAEAQKRGATF